MKIAPVLGALDEASLAQIAAVIEKPSGVAPDPFSYDWGAFIVKKSKLPTGWTFQSSPSDLYGWHALGPMAATISDATGYTLQGAPFSGAQRRIYFVPTNLRAPLGLVREDLIAAVRAAAKAKTYAPELLGTEVRLTPGEASRLMHDPGQGWLHARGNFRIYLPSILGKPAGWHPVAKPKSKNFFDQAGRFGEGLVESLGDALTDPAFLAVIGGAVGAGIGAGALGSAGAGTSAAGGVPQAITAPGATVAAGAPVSTTAAATSSSVAASTAAGSAAASSGGLLGGSSLLGSGGLVSAAGAGLGDLLDLAEEGLDTVGGAIALKDKVSQVLSELDPDDVDELQAGPNVPQQRFVPAGIAAAAGIANPVVGVIAIVGLLVVYFLTERKS